MKFEEPTAYSARAAHCTNQTGLARDTFLKKFWDDLADDWIALDNTVLAIDNAQKNSSPNRAKKADIRLINPKSTPSRRVVIIDDDPALAGLLTALVGSLGYDVVVKEDSSASHTYEVRDSDIVFVDMLMPKVNGMQVLEQLARQNVQSAIVLMSSNDLHLKQAEEAVKKLGLQFLGMLHKPFHLPDVKSVLEAA